MGWSLLLLLLVQSFVLALSTSIDIPNTAIESSSLQDYLCDDNATDKIPSNTVLQLSPDIIHYIYDGPMCTIENRKNITIKSRNSSIPAIVRCNSSSITQRGFGFYNISELMIKDVHFANCGGIIAEDRLRYSFAEYYSGFYGPNQQLVLVLNYCSDVHLDHVTFTDYRGYAIGGFNVFGHSILNNVHINHSYYTLDEIQSYFALFNTSFPTLEYSGSGAIFSYLDTGFPGLNGSRSSLVINDSSFTSGINSYPPHFNNLLINMLDIFRLVSPLPFTGAGGLTLNLGNLNFDIDITVSSSIISHNYGTLSGGALFAFVDTIGHSRIHVRNCVFNNNSVPEGGSGAGLVVGFIYIQSSLSSISSSLANNFSDVCVDSVQISNTNFSNHRAGVGAAIYIYGTPQDVADVTVSLERVTFTDNEAARGGDCIRAVNEQSISFTQRSLVLNMVDIHSIGTGSGYTGMEQTNTGTFSFDNLGSVFINGTNEHQSIFETGKNSAVKATRTNIFIKGSIVFKNNTAVYGAAINLESNSYFFISEPANVLFQNNLALQDGGAIASYSTTGGKCIIQFVSDSINRYITSLDELDTLDINVTFVNNTARSTGNSIFAAPLYNCAWFPESSVQIPSNQILKLYQELFKFSNSSIHEQVRSSPERPCLCDAKQDLFHCINDEKDQDLGETIIAEAFPGKTFTVFAASVDHLEQPVPSLIITRISTEGNVRFENGHISVATTTSDRDCFPLNYTLYYQEGVDVQLEVSLPTTTTIMNVHVRLLDCPYGFELDPEMGICDCISIYKEREFTCSIQSGLIQRTREVWIGRAYHLAGAPAACSMRCPRDYCLPADTEFVNLSRNGSLCRGQRDRELCGRCKEGFSLLFGTSVCRQCSNFWLFTIVLYALVGILLVIILFVLRMTVTTGTINGLIFYAQAVGINGDLLFHQTRLKFLVIFISVLNLDLGFPICFYDGMDFLAKTALQFVFPAYLWGIAISIIILSKFSPIVQKLTTHAVPVLNTLLFLSFTKLLRTVCTVFIGALLISENHSYLVWFYDGSIPYMTGRHLILGIVAIAVLLLFVCPYVIALLLAPWCLKSKRMGLLKPVIDAYLAPYKDKYLIWFGLKLLLITVMVTITILLLSPRPILTLHSQLILVIFFTVSLAYFRPYRSKAINVLNLFFLTNFCTLLGVSIYALSGADTINPSDDYQIIYLNTTVGLLVGSVFIIFWGIVLYHIWIATGKFNFMYYLKRCFRRQRRHVPSTEVSLYHQQGDSEHELEVQHDEGPRPRVFRGSRYRESLLEYLTETENGYIVA